MCSLGSLNFLCVDRFGKYAVRCEALSVLITGQHFRYRSQRAFFDSGNLSVTSFSEMAAINSRRVFQYPALVLL